LPPRDDKCQQISYLILREIIEPSAVIEEAFQIHVVETVDFETIPGRLVEQTANSVTLDPISAIERKPVTIDRDNILTMEQSKVSTMPEGLLDGFTKDEIANLLTFVISGGNFDP